MAGLDTASVVTTFNEDIERACNGYLPKQVIEILCRLSEQQHALERMYNLQNEVLTRYLDAIKTQLLMTKSIGAELKRINGIVSDNHIHNEQIGGGDD